MLSDAHKAKMRAGRAAKPNRTRIGGNSPLRAVRDKCMDCAGTTKMIRFCPCHGKDGSFCPLWPFRFGKRPSTMKKGADAAFLDPDNIPASLTAIEDCDVETVGAPENAVGAIAASANAKLGGSE